MQYKSFVQIYISIISLIGRFSLEIKNMQCTKLRINIFKNEVDIFNTFRNNVQTPVHKNNVLLLSHHAYFGDFDR